MNGHANGHARPAEGLEPGLKLGNFSLDENRPIKVVCIGAGYAGIVAGIRFRQRIPNIDLTIYEKENGVGGTWYVNRYPGLHCDIPSHSYQLSFEPNTQWSAFYAPGPEILAYIQRVVEKYKLMQHIRLRHELAAARWDEETAKWHLKIRRGPDGEEFEDTADVLFLGTGALSRYRWPDTPGLDTFGGTLVHSAKWDLPGSTWQDGVEGWKEKNVGVIGNGSTGIQVVTALQPGVKSLTNFIRNNTWLAASFSIRRLQELTGRAPDSTDYVFDPEFKEKLKDPNVYKPFWHDVEASTNSVAALAYKDSPLLKEVSEAFRADMERRLARKPELIKKLIPKFSVGCRRLTPGPGYLEALCEDNCHLEDTHIARVTPTGVELKDGRHVPLDVLICATGFDTSFLYPFPITGRNGLKLTDRWEAHAEAYMTVCVDGFPNLWIAFGPNSALNSGSFTVVIEKQVDYAVAATAKMQRERLRSVEVKPEAVKDFNQYARGYFEKTVYREDCSSWYKGARDDTITGLWPGSCLHLARVLQNPRWEDFNYAALPEDRTTNRFYWLGDGLTLAEKTEDGDRAWYLNNVDIPPVPQ
ncbi:FAD/NAD-binding domain-containing protein [Peniophora sp. CONT]|nr:FAD/NAD-binding domain-containing protein [Peniophora sp. CONT]